ncbi:MAG: universal stress protein [Candidatus Obscuribacterales bacterium]|nr:universal stress protein [Candidatus Obscuribacterales bacterium]
MKILLATDGSANADAALDIVLYRPWEAGTKVRVISVIEPLHDKVNKIVGILRLTPIATEAHTRHKNNLLELVEKYSAKLREKFGADNVSWQVVEGKPKETIVAEADKFNADTIIMGAHGRNESGEFLFGSVPEYVLSHAKCSVEILRAISPSTMVTEIERQQPIEEDKYLIALDDSDCSAVTLQEVLNRQWPAKPFFKVISVVEPLPFQAYTGLGPWEGAGSEEYLALVSKTMEAEQSASKKIVENAISQLKAKFPDATVSSDLLDGYAKDGILQSSKDWPADLIIMGSHGRGGMMEFVLGSVSKATAMHAPCSVIVVRAKAGSNGRNN